MLLDGAWKCVVALCLLAVAGTAAAQDRHEMMSGITSGVVSQSMQGRRRRPVQAPVATSRVFMPDVLPFVETSRDNQNEIAPAANRRGYYAQPPNAREDIDPKIDPGNSIPESNDSKDVVLNMNELSMDTQLLMSEAKTVEEFARIMGFELPPTNVNVAASSSGIAARFGGSSDDGLSVAVNADCTPENTTVMLKIEPELNVMFFPRCVRLPRCGGCCPGPLLKCRPTSTSTVSFKILRVEESTPSGRSAGAPEPGHTRRVRPTSNTSRRRRQATSRYITIDEEAHNQCKCQCRIQEQDCNPAIQDYNPTECRCVCKNQDEQSKCSDKNQTHYWSEKDCACYCYTDDTCSTGQRYDHNLCSCTNVNVAARSGFSELPSSATGLDRRPATRVPITFGG